jgi:acyl-CoA synthetase (AMP-forming)/AMP-acid ligase II
MLQSRPACHRSTAGTTFQTIPEMVRGAGDRFGAAGEADLLAWCRSRMAGYKAPRSVVFVSELPLNAAGKVDKPQLAAKYQIALQLPLVTGW